MLHCCTLFLYFSQLDARYIRWVLTVPAIWTDQAKSFMHTAAFKVILDVFILSNDIIMYPVRLAHRFVPAVHSQSLPRRKGFPRGFCCAGAGSMSGQRRRRWTNIEPTLAHRLVPAVHSQSLPGGQGFPSGFCMCRRRLNVGGPRGFCPAGSDAYRASPNNTIWPSLSLRGQPFNIQGGGGGRDIFEIND